MDGKDCAPPGRHLSVPVSVPVWCRCSSKVPLWSVLSTFSLLDL